MRLCYKKRQFGRCTKSLLKKTKIGTTKSLLKKIFFDPQTHTSRGIEFDLIVSGIHEALLKGKKELGISSKIIMCFLRHLSEKEAFKILDQAINRKNKIVGVGLDSSEIGNPPRKFEKVFIYRSTGLAAVETSPTSRDAFPSCRQL